MLSRAEREAFERALRAAFGRVMAAQAESLLATLGSPPDVRNIPDDVWNRLSTQLRAALEPLLVRMAVRSATGLVDESGLAGAADWTLVNGRAAAWANRYTFELVRGINSTTRDMLNREIASFYKDAGVDLKTLAGRIAPDIPDLRDRLGRIIRSDVRAEMIAVTETTRAASAGEQVLVDEIRRLNPNAPIVQIWLTANDELVCPQCGPLHGKRLGDGWTTPPPKHPRCRCGMGTSIDLTKAVL
jgi:hypothetical protein